jgi:hypothetical protein
VLTAAADGRIEREGLLLCAPPPLVKSTSANGWEVGKDQGKVAFFVSTGKVIGPFASDLQYYVIEN